MWTKDNFRLLDPFRSASALRSVERDIAAVNDPTRFKRSRGLGAYFGLTPRRRVGNRCVYTNSHQKLGSPSTH